MRQVAEWLGSHDNAAIPPRVSLRVFAKFGGVCQCGCGIKINCKPWQTDHRLALINGGEHREANLQPILTEHHKEKTKLDLAQKSKSYRKRLAQAGIRRQKRKIPYRRFNGEAVLR